MRRKNPGCAGFGSTTARCDSAPDARVRRASRSIRPMNSDPHAAGIKVCILDNDNLDAAVADTYVSYGAMTEKMFAAAGTPWQFDRFNTTRQEYPDKIGRASCR